MDAVAVAEIVKALAALGAAFAIGFGAVGPAIGIGLAGGSADEGMARQPKVTSELFRTMLIGQAVSSTPPTFALVISFLLLFQVPYGATLIKGFAALGAGICIGVASFASGAGSSLPAGQACIAIARQPHLRRTYTMQMLLGQALTQTALIFALLVSFMLLFLPSSPFSGVVNYVAALSAGICMGFGAVGASIGSGFAAGSAIRGVKHHRDPGTAFGPITMTMLLGVSVGHASCIYALIVSLSLIHLATK
jgi:ATP synthase F0 subunit c